MVLLSFSEPDHVKKILDGRKKQTTRQERKNPVKVGDVLQVYYKSRCAKTCLNCIYGKCMYAVQGDSDYTYAAKCDQHSNFFGTARVTSVETICFDQMTAEQLDAWALADGFDSWGSAYEWFEAHYSKKFGVWSWKEVPWVVIHFEGDWLEESTDV